MLLLATLALIAWSSWRGASLTAIGLMAAGLVVQLAQAWRLLGASVTPIGAHAEWLRATSTRPRLGASFSWLVGLLLVLAGLGVALWR